ncbi:hypothetical protein AB0395_01855 [Streptosporangium sp. NPDC051023]|uniref:hypothetical protein n=1 Tax=Streptosporangium sp. NPDC051023 TaxID=3155410 RepID=UPI00344FA6C5
MNPPPRGLGGLRPYCPSPSPSPEAQPSPDDRWAIPAVGAAERLKHALADLWVTADVHLGFGVALVSVWTDLLVLTDGRCFRWWTGELDRKGNRVYAYCSADSPVTAAHDVAKVREILRARRPERGTPPAHPV